jgi:ADP-ribose pyrophosphatase
MSTKPPSKYPILETSVVHENPFYSVVYERIQIDKKHADYYIVHKDCPSVFIVAYQNEKVLLVNQYRHQIREKGYELPAGSCNKDESPEAGAVRELQEETGYLANDIRILNRFYAVPGISDIAFYALLASDLTKTNTNREYSEDIIDQQFFTISEVKAKILSGEIVDGPTISSLHYFFLSLNV